MSTEYNYVLYFLLVVGFTLERGEEGSGIRSVDGPFLDDVPLLSGNSCLVQGTIRCSRGVPSQFSVENLSQGG